MLEVKKLQPRDEKIKTQIACSKCKNREDKVQDSVQKLTNSENERMFSDTLNPRVTHLQAKIG